MVMKFINILAHGSYLLCMINARSQAFHNYCCCLDLALLDSNCRDNSSQLPKFSHHNFTRLSLNAFVITDTELKLIAAAAMIGESNKPKNGYSTPAATGTPSVL